jgi:hypothetical protein
VPNTSFSRHRENRAQITAGTNWIEYRVRKPCLCRGVEIRHEPLNRFSSSAVVVAQRALLDNCAGCGILPAMTHKSSKVAEMVAQFAGRELDARYLGYFECFNRQRFYEAHEVLEDLWLMDRRGPDGDFFKGLIQLAGAFVHLQKNRFRPADALFQLAERNFRKYPAQHKSVDVAALLELTRKWREALSRLDFKENPLSLRSAPTLPWPG